MIYVFMADGFEEIEAFVPIDVLLRAGMQLKTVGVTGKQIKSKHGISIEADLEIQELELSQVEMIILPGGPGTAKLQASETVSQAIDYCRENGRYIAAICAAPSILAQKGMLTGRTAVCHPSVESKMCGAILKKTPVYVDHEKKVITSRGAGTAFDFAFALCKLLTGEENVKKISGAICYEG